MAVNPVQAGNGRSRDQGGGTLRASSGRSGGTAVGWEKALSLGGRVPAMPPTTVAWLAGMIRGFRVGGGVNEMLEPAGGKRGCGGMKPVAPARLAGAGMDVPGGATCKDACGWCSSSSRKERDVVAEVVAGMRAMARGSMGFTRW